MGPTSTGGRPPRELWRALRALCARLRRRFDVAGPSGPQSGYKRNVVAAAAYYRVSSDSQDHTLQRETCRRAAAARADDLVSEFEEKRQRDARKRPRLDAALAAARAGEFQRLYVYKLDRLTVGARDLLNVLAAFDEVGCELVAVADTIPLAKGPMRDFFLAGVGVVAELELSKIRDRMRDARTALERKGKKWGRPRRQLTARQLEQAQELVRRNISLRRIAVRLKVPRSTLQRALTATVSQKPPSEVSVKTPGK